jgi:GxxExxY protein
VGLNHEGAKVTKGMREESGLGAEVEAMAARVIGAAIEVHRQLGPGLLESIYQRALEHEFRVGGVPVRPQERVPVIYKGLTLGEPLVIDFLFPDLMLLEIKAVDDLHPIHHAQVITYLRLTGLRLGLLINFNVELLKKGMKRIIL